MTFLRRLVSVLRWIFNRRKAEQGLDDELEAFVDVSAAETMRDGLSLAEARRLAMLELGGVEQAKERVRTDRHGAWLDEVGRDMRYAFRMFVKQPFMRRPPQLGQNPRPHEVDISLEDTGVPAACFEPRTREEHGRRAAAADCTLRDAAGRSPLRPAYRAGPGPVACTVTGHLERGGPAQRGNLAAGPTRARPRSARQSRRRSDTAPRNTSRAKYRPMGARHAADARCTVALFCIRCRGSQRDRAGCQRPS